VRDLSHSQSSSRAERGEAPTNEPVLARADRPPGLGEGATTADMLLHLGGAIGYIHKYGYFVPSSLDVWKYRRRLTALDPACLKELDSHGALTLEELTASLNRDGALRLLSNKTGIRCIATETVRDWIELARRRGLIAHWAEAGSADNRHLSDPDPRWMLSGLGHEELLTPLQRFAKNNSPAALLGAIFGGGAVFGALASNPTVLTILIFLAAFVVYVLGLSLYFLRDQRRNGPGAAVVVIETIRCNGKPIPALPLDA
jgi:hypothetical protein